MELMGMLVIGLGAGLFSRRFLQGDDLQMGTIWAVCLGVGGVLLGNIAAGWLNLANRSGLDWARWLVVLAVTFAAVAGYLWWDRHSPKLVESAG